MKTNHRLYWWVTVWAVQLGFRLSQNNDAKILSNQKYGSMILFLKTAYQDCIKNLVALIVIDVVEGEATCCYSIYVCLLKNKA
jgi:hypothetical protein